MLHQHAEAAQSGWIDQCTHRMHQTGATQVITLPGIGVPFGIGQGRAFAAERLHIDAYAEIEEKIALRHQSGQLQSGQL